MVLNYTHVSGFTSCPLQMLVQLSTQHCAFTDNVGGCMKISAGATIQNSLFMRSSTAVRMDSCSVLIDSSHFERNVTSGAGGAIRVQGSGATAGDSIIIRHTTFLANSADSGGAIWVRDVNLLVEDVGFDSNTALYSAGALDVVASDNGLCRMRADSLAFTGNNGAQASALLLAGSSAASPIEARITNSIFVGNAHVASQSASAFAARFAKQMSGEGSLLSRCLFYDNDNAVGSAGAVLIEDAASLQSLELRSLTVVLNQAQSAGIVLNAPTMLRNSIVTDNTGTYEITGSGASVAYCLTTDTQWHGGGGSFYADPAFEDFWGRDFRLTAGSVAINRGDPSSLYDDADGTRADIGALTADPFPAVLDGLTDVPHDNGRQLMLEWLPSAGDDSRHGIASYLVYRRVSLFLLENWELISTIPAAQLPGYGCIVPTLADSNGSGVPYYSYFVRAQSVNPLAFWDTPIDSAYSVDNVAPAVPELDGREIASGIELTWTASLDSDLAYYAIYRADTLFDPDTATVVYAMTSEPIFVDSMESGSYSYAVRAVDYNGNTSDASNVVSAMINVVYAPQDLTLISDGAFLWLRWQSSPGATIYRIYASSQFGGADEFIGTTADTTYVLTIGSPRRFFWVTGQRE